MSVSILVVDEEPDVAELFVPVMMVTASGDEERRRQAAEYGAAEFLTKPVDFERLKAQLGQLPSAGIEETRRSIE